jgi:hypothetical protein
MDYEKELEAALKQNQEGGINDAGEIESLIKSAKLQIRSNGSLSREEKNRRLDRIALFSSMKICGGDENKKKELSEVERSAESSAEALQRARFNIAEAEKSGMVITEQLAQNGETIKNIAANLKEVDSGISFANDTLRRMTRWFS